MGNAESILELDACVSRERGEAKPERPAVKPRAVERATPLDELTPRRLRALAPPRLTIPPPDHARAGDEGATPSERLRRMAYRTEKDDFIDEIRVRKGERVRQRQQVADAPVPRDRVCKAYHNEATEFLETFDRRPDIALTYGDVGGPNVVVEANKVRSKYEDRVKQRMTYAEMADRRRRAGSTQRSPSALLNLGPVWKVN